ncbi:MAG: class I SAM-dependent methyltransferase [Solibacillus sp.]
MFKNERIHDTSHILDVGCGTGQTAAYLSQKYGANVTGIDMNPVMVEKAKKRMSKNDLSVNLLQCAVEEIPFPNQYFDFIISESVLSFVDKPRALDEIFRLLKKGGRFIAIEQTMNWQLEKTEENEIKQFYGLDSLLLEQDWLTLLQQAGFEEIHILQNSAIESEPDFHYSDAIDPSLYEVMKKHLYIISKYQEAFSYRVYLCTK